MSKEKGLLFDVTLCVGCGACYQACKEQNNLKQTSNDFLKDHLSDNTFTIVEQYDNLYARKLCMHCNDPACVSVCLVGAIKKQESGAVVYDADKCIGCRYCMQACPHHVPRYEWSSTQPRIKKCNMCTERVSKGQLPACVDSCPTEATLFGDKEQLIEIAKKRLLNNPEKYYQHIYGLEEAGGSNVMILSPVPFEQLGYISKLPKKAMPDFTAQAMDKIPSVVVGGGAFLAGMYWLTKRKNQIAKEEKINNKE
ncbi:MAG: 4Fe-4S dicluster domain-containing protein [Ignavibacteriota bacterium]|jgi:formate dehydrogenase iron-sulfur subunit|nr:MAG: 4Fe-4S dicluster domain-containing protein [Chlorobiota bacterium]MBE7476714.1 4Fe-4S dicluster domain-containing protein [Ignavibacteriales bacterium]MBL1122034.1 4Fe-4S dicluster domain-containing protein [Ignavibacteriota bacterium]MCC7093593.1 4Fe-4S dicluster domain-containing protein [Ignavibacteriaceae bacterium]MCE7856112.1 4Fe-4S dicluster domain-containing protein [Ignavibacteria bacterium CHB3]